MLRVVIRDSGILLNPLEEFPLKSLSGKVLSFFGKLLLLQKITKTFKRIKVTQWSQYLSQMKTNLNI